jgi:ryanodine receptor 2
MYIIVLVQMNGYNCFYFLLQAFLYSLWYFIFSILGNFNNFFFAAHLLDVAVGFKTLRTILQSVTHNGKQVRL